MSFLPKGCRGMRWMLSIFVLFACVWQAKGQFLAPDATLEQDFMAQVKSLDEFAARFNGWETKPGLPLDSLNRQANILSLFDFNISQGGLTTDEFKKELLDFVHAVLSWGELLSVTNENAYAEAKCRIEYNKRAYYITLLMKREITDRKTNRWAVSGVKGISSLGLYSDKRLVISPVDHETHFMSLQDFFQLNPKVTPSMRAKDREIDELSFFFGLCVTKAIKFVQVDDLKFHFMDVPGYIFVVEEIGRRGTNSGWLITQLKKASMSEKKQYKMTLFGENQ